MTSHIMEYDVGTHLANLKDDYPEAFGRVERLEDVVPKDNEDLKAILDFRKACDEADSNGNHNHHRGKYNGAKKRFIDENRNYIIHEFEAGTTITVCAEQLGVARSTLTKYVSDDEELDKIYHKHHKRRRILSKDEINQLYAMYKQGYTKTKIARKLGISEATVLWRVSMMRKREESND